MLTFYANLQLRENAKKVENSNKIISNLELIFSRISNDENRMRGYLITENKNLPQPYFVSRIYTDSLFTETVNLHSKFNKPSEYLLSIKNKINKKYALIDSVFNTFNKDNFVLTTGLRNNISSSDTLMDEIRDDILALQTGELKMLKERKENLKKTSDAIYSIIAISIIIAFFLVLFALSYHLKENREKREAEANASAYQDELSKSIADLRTANDEMDKLRSHEKFDATGRIARTIAHEIRNPLTNINLATDQLSTEMIANENSDFLFEMINRNTNRINVLISDLLNSTKFSELSYEKVSINALLEETLQLAQDRIHLNNVTLIKNFSEDICDISADKEKIKIAFLNVIINALEAMQGKPGATFTIQTSKVDEKCIVTMSDNGDGIDEESITKLFEPYFTKKPKGNGLGLTNTQNIIFNHRGTIIVESKVKVGTTFTISLRIDQ